MNIRQRRAGFTLLELLVVVVIIGILASVALPKFLEAQDKARNSSVMANVRTVFTGVEQWRADHQGQVPAELIGTDVASNVVAPAPGMGATFSYTAGGLLPNSPWGKNPQVVMPAAFTNATLMSSNPTISDKIKNGEAYDQQQGFFIDGYQTTAGQPPDAAGPNERADYGFLYYCGAIDIQRYAIYGVGKRQDKAVVVAIKTNYSAN